MLTQAEKGAAFHALHARAGAFIIPNPWDIGTARLLTRLGFEALATTSAGYAFSVGQPDSTVGGDETMAHVAAIVSATDLPVSADLENGFGDTPQIVAETIKLAAQAGLVGGSIEDVSGRVNCTVYELGHAAERIRAAAEAVRHLPFRFTLTARAENFVVGRPDLNDTIKRLQAYQEPAPTSLARAAFGAFLRAAREMRERGTFEFANEAVGYRDINAMFDD